MIVRDRKYLNRRYRGRPDQSYSLYGYQSDGDFDGILVARLGGYAGMRWGYIVDFLAPERSPEVLSALIGEAIAEFRALGAAAVVCFAGDKVSRGAFFRCGFLSVLQRRPVHFIRFIRSERTDLAGFVPFENWYVTMGD